MKFLAPLSAIGFCPSPSARRARVEMLVASANGGRKRASPSARRARVEIGALWKGFAVQAVALRKEGAG